MLCIAFQTHIWKTSLKCLESESTPSFVLVEHSLDMNRLMRRLSRSSLGQSSHHNHHNHQMADPCVSTDTSQADSVITDSDTSSMDESKPPRIPPPPPPNPPPRRRRKQRSVFYSSTPSLLSTNEEVSALRPSKRPAVPPPIPPRSVSITGESSQKCSSNETVRPNSQNDSSMENIFSNEELIDNLTQNLSVMEELNQSLRNQLKECKEENSLLVNELAAIRIERNQMLQTCKEIDTLKDNEWLCSICLDDRQLIVSTERQIVATLCGHLFCNVCFDMALGLESVCPTCRKPVPAHHKRPYIFLYF